MRDFHADLPPTSTVFVGIDLHRRRWHVTARTAEAELFSASIEGTREALRHVLDRFRGYPVEAVYEAGYFGYWLHDRLAEYGASCVVTPRASSRRRPATASRPTASTAASSRGCSPRGCSSGSGSRRRRSASTGRSSAAEGS